MKTVFQEYVDKISRKIVQKTAEEKAKQSGLDKVAPTIQWNYLICDSRDSAEAWLRIHRPSSADLVWMAVRFRVPDESGPLKSAFDQARKEYDELDAVLYPGTLTHKFITCKNPKCGSNLRRDMLKQNCCPVCGEDLRPATQLRQIEAARERMETAKAEYEATGKNGKNQNVKWLVKFEYPDDLK